MSPERGETGGARGASPKLEMAAAIVSRIGGALSALLILIVLAITAISVFNRYVLGKPLLGIDEATGFMVVAIVMFGAAEAFRRGDHIRIDLLFDHVGPRVRWWLELWSSLAVLAFAILLLRSAWHTVAFSRAFEAYSTGYLSLPLWIPQSTMVIGAGLIALSALAGILRQIGNRG
jgi:C4-dicarboxylate transporter, DctQ subunit